MTGSVRLGDVDAHHRLAHGVLVDEAVLTPKPGLVDRRGGAHADMDVELLLVSADALGPAFAACAAAGRELAVGPELRARLGVIGRDGEAAMLAATGGVNTHRGALWALGLLCAAGHDRSRPTDTGRLRSDSADTRHRTIERAAALARLPDPDPAGHPTGSHGARARAVHGAGGATAEAAAGFPHVTRHALPALGRARAAGADEASARLDALLALMAVVEDTCLLHRGGRSGLDAVRTGAAAVLAAGGCATREGRRRLSALDRLTRERRLSPGGSADLLAAALFLDRLTVRGDACRP